MRQILVINKPDEPGANFNAPLRLNFKLSSMHKLLICFVILLSNQIYSGAQQFSEILRDANNGDVRAMDKLGILYAEGSGVLKDQVKAKAWFERAANRGLAASQYNLAVILIMDSKYSEAALWLKKSSQTGHLKSFHKLGELYYDGKGVPKSRSESLKNFLIPANAGVPASMKRVAVMWQNAEGGSARLEPAVEVLTYLANLGDVQSQIMLSNCYDGAIGVDKDDKLAIHWCQLAANQGHPAAKNNMGVLLAPRMLNENPHSDVVRSFMWFNLAAADGNEYAARQREKLRRHMTEEQIKRAEADSLEFLPKQNKFDNWRPLDISDTLRSYFKIK